MALQSMQNDDMSLVLSKDVKPRLKWTPELHQLFLDAVTQLGGADKATPKSLMRVMNIHGLTLYHLKSHLQKYRQGKSRQLRHCHNKKQQDYSESQNRRSHIPVERCNGMQNQKNESVQIARALQVQMEVQRKIHEQIEVQRHLQLRIEAQGKYLQSALKKAQEILSKAELSLLVSPRVDMGCPSSSESGLTEIGSSMSKDKENSKQLGTGTRYSLKSSLTSFESCERKEETEKRNTVELFLMTGNDSKDGVSARKRRSSTSCDDIWVEKPSDKRCKTSRYDKRLKSLGFLKNLDLNGKSLNNFDTDRKAIDLNREWW